MQYIILLIVLLLSGCAGHDRLNLHAATYDHLSGWHKDEHEQVMTSFQKSCKNFDHKGWNYLARITDNPEVSKKLREKCKIVLKQGDQINAKEFFEKHFEPHLVSNNGNFVGKFTGYHDYVLKGSRVKKGKYKFPIYAKPKDLYVKRPYFSRSEIETKGVLRGKNLEIAYTDDLVDLFFLQIQGSGILLLDNGKKIRLSYDGQNGHKYYAIGKYLVEKERVPVKKINAEFIKNWLRIHPKKAVNVMHKNPSYVFFKEANSPEIKGAHAVALTPERSLAIDRKFIPFGALMWVETTSPLNNLRYNKLMVSQDTGGAIKGVVRGDIYFGQGYVAQKNASYMNSIGRYFILLPK